MKKNFLFCTLACFSFLSFNLKAQNCSYRVDPKDIVIKWAAYKTPAKVPAEGTFKNIKFKGTLQGQSIAAITQGLSVSINSQSVDTGKPERDATIKKSFFGMMKNKKISAKILALRSNDLDLEITMNDVKQKIVMASKTENNLLEAEGTIDVLNFALNQALDSLALACKVLHENKTWPDVKLKLSAKFTKKCL